MTAVTDPLVESKQVKVTAMLVAQDLCKRFYATQALDHVSFDLRAGEVHSLVGENGAGKSTLIKILGGAIKPDSGRLMLDYRELSLASPSEAFSRGIAVIQQELRVVPALSVAENVMLGHLPVRRGLKMQVDRAAMREKARAALARLNVSLNLDRRVSTLGFPERQSIAIARALSRAVRVLILDEPTAALEKSEVLSLFNVIERLKAEGVGVIYVSHSLDEVLSISDRCTVLRDGRVVTEYGRGDLSVDALTRSMTGRNIDVGQDGAPRQPGDVLLETQDEPRVRLRAGEITGLAGLLGSGTSSLLKRIFGGEPGGRVVKDGEPLEVDHPASAVKAAIGYVPNERALGLVLSLSVRDNIILPSLRRFSSYQRMDRRTIDSVVNGLIEALDIRPRDPSAIVRSLSGGNQQKVVIAKWLAAKVDVLLMDEPTQGIDIAAKAHIHRLMREFAEKGGSVLFASSDSPELLEVADAVIAMRHERITARIVSGSELTEQAVRAAISG